MSSASANVEVKHVSEEGGKVHGLEISGETLKRFKGGLRTLVDLAKECQKFLEPEKVIPGYRTRTTSIDFITQWIETNSIWPPSQEDLKVCTTTYNSQPIKVVTPEQQQLMNKEKGANVAFIGAIDAYEMGWAIGSCLHTTNSVFEFMVRSFKIPKTLAEWKTSTDKHCKRYAEQISAMIYGLIALRGYIEEIRSQYKFYESELPPKSNNTPQKPILSPDELAKLGYGTFEVADPSYAILGDCHPEFWMSQAERSPMRGYYGLKRNCTSL